MALGVNIIHKTKNQSLNDNGKLYGVLIDDTISEIKNKIFANTDDFYKQTISFYPNLIKLEMNNIILKDETRNLSFYISDISDTYNIYVTSVFDIIINKEKYDNIDLDAYKLYTCLKNDDSIILELYEKLVEDFTELRQDDLEIIIKMKKITKKRILAPAKSVHRFAKKIDRSADRQIADLIFWDTLFTRRFQRCVIRQGSVQHLRGCALHTTTNPTMTAAGGNGPLESHSRANLARRRVGLSGTTP